MQKGQSYTTPAGKAFMELVRCGLSGANPDEILFSDLSSRDWEEIYTLAKRQTVCGICYDAYRKLPDCLLPPGTLLPRWVARVNAIETTNRAMTEAVTLLVRMMRAMGLNPIIQKGISVARFYKNPELRECGDIDLWLPASEFGSGIEFARKTGSNIKSNPDGSISFLYRCFVIELHSQLINVSSPFASRSLASFGKRHISSHVTDATIPSPTPLIELLLINVHIMKHVFGTGIGLRHICDYLCASYALKGHYSEARFEKMCSVLGISKWTALLNDFLVTHLHADPEKLPPSGLKKANSIPTETLMKIIMEGGNFGQHLADGRTKKRHRSGHSKLHTLSMFLKRSRFAASVAPAEASWNFFRLLVGQIH